MPGHALFPSDPGGSGATQSVNPAPQTAVPAPFIRFGEFVALTLPLAACYKGKGFIFPIQPGPVAQLGARMTGSHEVEGSNPSRSTNLILKVMQ